MHPGRHRLSGESIQPASGDWIDLVATFPNEVEIGSSPEKPSHDYSTASVILQRIRVLSGGRGGITGSATPREAKLLIAASEFGALDALMRLPTVDDVVGFEMLTAQEVYDSLDVACCALPPERDPGDER